MSVIISDIPHTLYTQSMNTPGTLGCSTEDSKTQNKTGRKSALQ